MAGGERLGLEDFGDIHLDRLFGVEAEGTAFLGSGLVFQPTAIVLGGFGPIGPLFLISARCL